MLAYVEHTPEIRRLQLLRACHWGSRKLELAILCWNYCRPMINKLPPFEGLNIRILITIAIEEGGVIHQGVYITWHGSPCWPSFAPC